MGKTIRKPSEEEVIFHNFPLSQYRQSLKSQSGQQDSNLRPSAPKTPHRAGTALGFKAIPDFFLGSAKFVMTNKAIFARNLSEKY